MITCEIKLFQNYFILRQRPTEIIYYSAWKLGRNYFTGLLQLMNIFQHVQCPEIISVGEIILFQFQTWLHVK